MRKKHGYTQKEVADLLNINRSTYAYYELGKIKPDIETIMKIAEIFTVHYTQILDSESATLIAADNNQNVQKINNNYNPDVLNFDELNADEKNTILLFRMLTKEAQQETYKFMHQKLKQLLHWGGNSLY